MVASDAALLEGVPGPGCDGDAADLHDHGVVVGVAHQVDYWEVQGSGGEVCNRGKPYAKLRLGWQEEGLEGKRRLVGGGNLTQNLTRGLRNGLGRRRRDHGAVLASQEVAGGLRLSGPPVEPRPPLGQT